MNTKIKQTLALVLALVLCLGLFAGCKGNGDPTKASRVPVSVSDKNSEIYPLKSDKTFTVFCGSAKLDEKYVNQFWTEVTGVKTDWVQMDAGALKGALAAKEIPDIFALCGGTTMTKAQAKEYGDAGLFIDYSDYLDIMPNVSALFEKYPEALAVVQNDDGSIYSLPQVGGKIAGLNSIGFRNDMLQAAGWTKTPSTTDEFLQCIKDIQAHFGKDDPEFCAFNIYRANYMNWGSTTHGVMAWFFPAFGELLSTGISIQDGKVVFGAITDQYKHTLEYLNQIWNSGAINTSVYEEDGTQARALIAQNKVACGIYMSTLAPSNFASGKIDVSVCEPFTSPYYAERHHTDIRTDASWDCYMISAKCSDIETACQWMDAFYATEENPLNEEGTIWGISFSLGEYGVHWTKNEENKTYALHEVNGITTGNATNMVNLCAGWYDFSYILEGDKTYAEVAAAQVNEKVQPYREKWSDYNLGGLNLTEEESDTYADHWTGIDKYIAEMTAKFITGQEDINAKWSEYLNQLNALGLQKVINLYQEAYNRAVNVKK